jgi:hypothetical protein
MPENEQDPTPTTLTENDLMMMKGEGALHLQSNEVHANDPDLMRRLQEDFLSVFNRMGPSATLLNVASVLTASAKTIHAQASEVPESEQSSDRVQSLLSQLHVINHAVELIGVVASMVKPFNVVMNMTDSEDGFDGNCVGESSE